MKDSLSGVATIVGLLAFIPSSCSRTNSAYSPPAQIKMPSGPEPGPVIDPRDRELLAMSDPDADARIAGDVFRSTPGAEWRFTGLHPVFRLQVERAVPFNFYVRFYQDDEVLRARGPVTFSISINGNRFQSQRFGRPGDQEFRRLVPVGWIAKPGVVEISIDIDPPWRASDGATYGILLNSVGFEER